MPLNNKQGENAGMFGFVNAKPMQKPAAQNAPITQNAAQGAPVSAPVAPQNAPVPAGAQNAKPTMSPASQNTTPLPIQNGVGQNENMHFNANPIRNAQTTYIAAGTSFEGTISSQGDIEIVGNLKGDIVSQGKVTLYNSTFGNITAADLVVDNCSLTGDVHVSNSIVISHGSEIKGNVFCGGDAQVAGLINGDIQTANYMSIDATAIINGSVEVGMMSVARGAVIIGNLKITTR